MTSRTPLLLVLVFGSGCLAQLWADGLALFPDGTDTDTTTDTTASSTSSSTTDDGAPTDGIQTVTGVDTTANAEGTAWQTGEPDETGAPAIVSFAVSPGNLGEAGAAMLQVVASDDAVAVRVRDNGSPLVELAPAEFPHAYEVLSDAFDGQHTFEAVALDAEGRESAIATATLSVDVPAAGVEKCVFDGEKSDAGVALSMVAGLAHASDAIVAVGTRDTDTGPRLAVWKLGRDQCEVLPGWPKAAIGLLANKMSGGTAVTVDADGNLFVAGFVLEGITPRRYLAKLNAGGSVLWEDLGEAGEEIAGVAVAPKPQAAVFAVGWRRSGQAPSPTDAAIWMYKSGGTPLPPDYMKAPFTPDEQPDEFNDRSEKLQAVVFEPTSGVALAIGEREFKDEEQDVYGRTFMIRIHPISGRMGVPWTSVGAAFNHDAGLALNTCGGELVAAGWRRDLLGDDPQPLLQWFERDGTFTELQPIAVSGAQFAGVACDREGKIVGAGARDLGQLDAFAVATPRSGGAPTWYEKGSPGEDQATAVSCDERGFCAWGGFRSEKGKRHAVVRLHHP